LISEISLLSGVAASSTPTVAVSVNDGDCASLKYRQADSVRKFCRYLAALIAVIESQE
jgi:hypothetical protein